ncbi:hypothetical protein [Gluconacetobacter sp.]|uniref:hypothetical protein n=1 Tax=Gluconacetobacter sp. TaxID=1935994 RepID=UPI0039E9C411
MTDKQTTDRKSIEEKRREFAQANARVRGDDLARAFEAKHGVPMEQWKRTKIAFGMPEQSANNTATAMAEEALNRKNEEDRQPAEDFAAGIEKSQSVQRTLGESRARLSGETATERGEANDLQENDHQ